MNLPVELTFIKKKEDRNGLLFFIYDLSLKVHNFPRIVYISELKKETNMGAETFMNVVHAVTSQAAYQQAKVDACHESGHGGYTGTIAEKGGYTMSNKPEEIDAETWVEMVEDFDEDDTNQKYYSELKKDFRVYDDKWGDALCIDCGKVEGKDYNKYILCGWASS